MYEAFYKLSSVAVGSEMNTNQNNRHFSATSMWEVGGVCSNAEGKNGARIFPFPHIILHRCSGSLVRFLWQCKPVLRIR